MPAEAKKDAHPRIVQLEGRPIFNCFGEADFNCLVCQSVLIAAFDGRSLIALDIQCRICGAVTRTPHWPDDEALPLNIVLVPSGTAFGIEGPISMDSSMAFIADVEYARVCGLTRSQPAGPSGIRFEAEWLRRLEVELDFFTNGDFGRSVAKAKRAAEGGDSRYLKSPLDWAVARLNAGVERGNIDFDGDDLAAVQYIQQYRNIVSVWKHHALFSSKVKAINSEFHHLVTELITLAYLQNAGNDIGITNTHAFAGQSPDLYGNVRLDDRLSIEVKTKEALYWPRENQTSDDLQRAVVSALKSAQEQITGSSGVVVIAASSFDPKLEHAFKAAICDVLSRGLGSRRIEGVIGVVHFSRVNLKKFPPLDTMANFHYHANPRFEGTRFIRAEGGPLAGPPTIRR